MAMKPKASTSYSPAKMTAAAKAKAAAKGKATAAKTKQKSLASKVAGRVGTTAREARDVVTAAGNFGAVLRNQAGTGAAGGKLKQLGKAASNLKTQVAETGRAATTGARGTSSKKYLTTSGDTPSKIQRDRNNKKRK